MPQQQQNMQQQQQNIPQQQKNMQQQQQNMPQQQQNVQWQYPQAQQSYQQAGCYGTYGNAGGDDITDPRWEAKSHGIRQNFSWKVLQELFTQDEMCIKNLFRYQGKSPS
jgi:hypothetical protein